MRLFKILFLLVMIALAGCSSRTYDVDVDSISISAARQKRKYVLLPGNKEVKLTDLQFQEFAAYTDKCLRDKGFIKVPYSENAELIIYLDYGISDPQEQKYTYSVPVYGQTGTSSTTTEVVQDYDDAIVHSKKTRRTPEYGLVGYSTRVGTKVVFERYLCLTGMDIEKYNRGGSINDVHEIWSTKVSSVGESGDLREIFPILLVASRDYIAESSGKKISCQLKENKELSKKVEEIRKGIYTPEDDF